MSTVAQLLTEKGNAVWSIEPNCSVLDALRLMAAKEIGALVVVEKHQLVGIVSERDYAHKVDLKGRSARNTPVRDIMTKEVLCVSPEQTVDECMTLMTVKRARHLPVLSENQLVGIISIGDVVRSLILDKEFLIQELEKYIVGDR